MEPYTGRGQNGEKVYLEPASLGLEVSVFPEDDLDGGVRARCDDGICADELVS